MSELSENVQRWMKQGVLRAQGLIGMGGKYRSTMQHLLFFYARAMFSIHGTREKTAKAMGIRYLQENWSTPPTSTDLNPELIEAAKDWAVDLAKAGATCREATFVFRISLFRAAIDLAKGNRGEASRTLGVHRNTLWQKVITNPEKVQALVRRYEQ